MKSMKRIICSALALVMCAGVAVAASGCGCQKDSKKTSASAANGNNQPGYKIEPTNPDFVENGFGFYRLNDNEVILTQYNGDDKNITIPETAQGAKVCVIGSNVFQNKSLESVTIPQGVTEIQKYSFSGCQNLKEINIPEGVKTIGNNAFWNCRNLTKINLPSTIKNMGWNAFSATGIKSIVLPESDVLSSIDDKVFFQCFDLSEVTIPLNITKIADSAFEDCSPELTIKAYTGSYGVSFAKTHNYKLVEMKRK